MAMTRFANPASEATASSGGPSSKKLRASARSLTSSYMSEGIFVPVDDKLRFSDDITRDHADLAAIGEKLIMLLVPFPGAVKVGEQLVAVQPIDVALCESIRASTLDALSLLEPLTHGELRCAITPELIASLEAPVAGGSVSVPPTGDGGTIEVLEAATTGSAFAQAESAWRQWVTFPGFTFEDRQPVITTGAQRDVELYREERERDGERSEKVAMACSSFRAYTVHSGAHLPRAHNHRSVYAYDTGGKPAPVTMSPRVALVAKLLLGMGERCPKNMSNANLCGVDLRGWMRDVAKPDIAMEISLSYSFLRHMSLTASTVGASMSLKGSIAGRSSFAGAYLYRADLSEAKLMNSTFVDAEIFAGNLSSADCRKATFVDANMTQSTLSGADLTEVTWDDFPPLPPMPGVRPQAGLLNFVRQ